MKGKFLILAFVCAGMSPVCAMSPEGGERSEKYSLLRMVPEADGQDFAVRDKNPFIAGSSQSANELKNPASNKQAPVKNSCQEEAKKVVREALRAVGVENPLAVPVACVDKHKWTDVNPAIINARGILIELNDDDKELFKYIAYQTAVEWQIDHGVEKYISNEIKNYRYIWGIFGGAFVLASGAVAEAASGDEGPWPMVNLSMAAVAAVVGSYKVRKRSQDNDENKVLNLDLHTAQALCANNHRDAVTRMIADINKEDSDNPVSQWWLIRHVLTGEAYAHNVRLKRKDLLQQVLDEKSGV